jgi:hypothetical protein
MWRIRKFEEAVEDLFGRGMMHGTMHLSIGQEASPTGMCMALTLQDQITSTHRGHGHCIAKGADLTRMIAELLGKRLVTAEVVVDQCTLQMLIQETLVLMELWVADCQSQPAQRSHPR